MEEAVIEFLVLTSLFGYLMQELAHGHDWDTQINRKSSRRSEFARAAYLLTISSAKTFGGVKKATLGAEGHLFIKPFSVLKRPFFALSDSLCNILF